MANPRIVVVDDEANARAALADLLKDENYDVVTAADGFKALAKIEDFDPHLVLTDLKMPGMDGLNLLNRLHTERPELPIVLMTAFGAVDTAVAAMRDGAADYLTKPLNMDELLVVIARALERARLRAETRSLKQRLHERYRFSNLIGSSPQMQSVFKTIAQVAPSRASVLITGESGTGKELVAAAIHQHSPRKEQAFVKLHCAALAETLLESELFGHERGAFTGADRRRAGRFEQAHQGTLFLDEVGEIPPATQVKLLRFLQEREYERVGGNETLKSDVRVVAATNRDLKDLVERGLFREDLFYRLNVINLRMPALRERKGDTVPLATYFLHKYAEENGKSLSAFSDAALTSLNAYDWPGNVRELENTIERAVVLAEGDTVEAQHIATEITGKVIAGDSVPPIPGSTLTELERYALLTTLEACGGSTSAAADMLGISVRKVQYKLQEYASAPKSGTPALQTRVSSSVPPPPPSK